MRDLPHVVIFVVLFSGGLINSKAPDLQPESVHSNLAGLPTFGRDRRTPTFQTASSQADELVRQLVVPVKFDEVRSFSGGLAWVRHEHQYGYIDKAGKFVWKAKLSN